MLIRADKSIYVRPVHPMDNVVHRDAVDSVLASNLPLAYPTGDKGADSPHVGFGQLRPAALLTLQPRGDNPSPCNSAHDVLTMTPLRKMPRVRAGRVVARVHDFKRVINGPICHKVRYPMSVIGLPPYPERAVPLLARRRQPSPAIVRGNATDNLREKSIGNLLCNSGDGLILSLHSMLHSLSATLRAVVAAPGLLYTTIIPKVVTRCW